MLDIKFYTKQRTELAPASCDIATQQRIIEYRA